MNRRGSVNHPDNFCYACGKFTPHDQRKNISAKLKIAYKHYFGCKLRDEDRSWAPHICCGMCYVGLTQWLNRKQKHMPFAVPMVWCEPTNHVSNCYFCMTNICGFSKKNRSKIRHEDCKSAFKPVPHDSEYPVPVSPSSDSLEDQAASDDEPPAFPMDENM